jgi:hypothetical protein
VCLAAYRTPTDDLSHIVNGFCPLEVPYGISRYQVVKILLLAVLVPNCVIGGPRCAHDLAVLIDIVGEAIWVARIRHSHILNPAARGP